MYVASCSPLLVAVAASVWAVVCCAGTLARQIVGALVVV